MVDVAQRAFRVKVFAIVEGVDVSESRADEPGVFEATPPVMSGIFFSPKSKDCCQTFEGAAGYEFKSGLVVVVFDTGEFSQSLTPSSFSITVGTN